MKTTNLQKVENLVKSYKPEVLKDKLLDAAVKLLGRNALSKQDIEVYKQIMLDGNRKEIACLIVQFKEEFNNRTQKTAAEENDEYYSSQIELA